METAGKQMGHGKGKTLFQIWTPGLPVTCLRGKGNREGSIKMAFSLQAP